jgi:hypothetical protein
MMWALQEVTWSGILIAGIVALSGVVTAWIARGTRQDTKTVAAETKKVAEVTATASTTQAELLLAKHDQVISKLGTLASTVERNRAQNAIEKLTEGHEVLFSMIADVDKKVTKTPRKTVSAETMGGK